MSVYPNKCIIEGHEIGDLCGDVTDCVKHGCARARAAPKTYADTGNDQSGEVAATPNAAEGRTPCAPSTSPAPAAPPDDMVRLLRQGASISRSRNLNLDYAKVAEEAAARIVALQAECNAVQVELNAWRAQAYENMDAVVAQEIRAERAEAEVARLTKWVAELERELRHEASAITELAATKDDNAALRAVVAAADAMRGQAYAHAHSETDHRICSLCETMKAYDAARAKLGEI